MYKIISLKWLRLAIGIFFVSLGLVGVLDTVDEGIFQLSQDYTQLELVFGIIELLSGVVIISGLFKVFPQKVMSMATLVVFAFWVVRVILTRFVWGGFMEPVFLLWLTYMMAELVIALAILAVYKAYE